MPKEERQGDDPSSGEPSPRDFAGEEIAESEAEQRGGRRESAMSADNASIGSRDQANSEDPQSSAEDRGVPRGDHAPEGARER